MCDHLCDGSRGMDDFNYFFVELKSNRNFKKSPLFWVVSLGLQIHVKIFDNSLR